MKLLRVALDDEAIADKQVHMADADHVELRSDAHAAQLEPQPDDALRAGLAPRIHEFQLLARAHGERGGQLGERASRDEAQLERRVGDDDKVAFGEAQERAFESKIDVVNRMLLKRASLMD